ncbi:uncharacterized protein OCT59_014287 [Rhizophagus irregularis]|uniref:uncharacterized protein n=1 Tax=Rhizophagus irregularis TaxID=588596 RepID=UPI00331F24C2|nr:hypothetical protein OCT59_014287 [Rhizophagus irregularis]
MLDLQGTFLKPAPEIVQKLEEAKHNLLEIKEWETCMEKEHSKKKEAQKRYREALSELNRKALSKLKCLLYVIISGDMTLIRL